MSLLSRCMCKNSATCVPLAMSDGVLRAFVVIVACLSVIGEARQHKMQRVITNNTVITLKTFYMDAVPGNLTVYFDCVTAKHGNEHFQLINETHLGLHTAAVMVPVNTNA